MANRNKNESQSFLSRIFSLKSYEYKAEQSTNNSKERTIVITPSFLVLVTYILLLISKFIDVALLNRDNEYMSVIILQMMIFLLPGALWCMLKGERYIKRLRISAPSLDTVWLIVSAALVMMTGGFLISLAFEGLDSLSNNFSLYGTFVSKQDGSVVNTLYLVLAYAALPALCEEFVFRGILCREFEDKGVVRAVALSSLFFGLLHFNLRNLPVYFFCGCMLALVLYATRSIWGAVITHFIYNLFGVFGQPYMATLYRLTKDSRLLFIIVGVLFFLSAAVFCGQASKLYRKYLRQGLSSSYRSKADNLTAYFKESFLDVLKDPFTIASIAVYIIAIVISWM